MEFGIQKVMILVRLTSKIQRDHSLVKLFFTILHVGTNDINPNIKLSVDQMISYFNILIIFHLPTLFSPAFCLGLSIIIEQVSKSN
jgi:hypothetical protein